MQHRDLKPNHILQIMNDFGSAITLVSVYTNRVSFCEPKMLGFRRGRYSGDRGSTAVSYPVGWIWMELVSDLLRCLAGSLPAPVPGLGGNCFGRSAVLDLESGLDHHWSLKTARRRNVSGGLVSARTDYGLWYWPYAIRVWDGWEIRKRCYPNPHLVGELRADPIWVKEGYKKVLPGTIKSRNTSSQSPSSPRLSLGFRKHFLARRFMATIGGGGDKGIVDEMITHPKPSDGGLIVLANPVKEFANLEPSSEARGLIIGSKASSDMAEVAENIEDGSYMGPAAFTEGDVDNEEEEAIEVRLEEEEVLNAGKWTVLASFYSMRIPSLPTLFDDMRRAWRLKEEMSYKSLRENLFIITFKAEGDHKFVLQGGPWIHRGDALLVADFDGITCPSKVPLESVPIWVRIYDLPLALMTKPRGELYGSRLGKVREVDVGDDGRNKHDFFRVRVDLPVNRPLKKKIAIKIISQGKEVTRSFDLRYERVPHFCFICGFLGHADKDCGRRVANEDYPFRFSADLRCSPMKPFERRISKVKAFSSPVVARNLFFKGAGSASSSSSRHNQGDSGENTIPPRVDAHDNFEEKELVGDGKVDEQLAQQAQRMKMVGEENPNMIGTAKESAPSQEMIPAIANLLQPASFGEVSSDELSAGHRKRVQEQSATLKTGRVKQALLEYQQTVEADSSVKEVSNITRAPKRFRKTDGEEESDAMEATSPGAAGKLTGPVVGSR